MDHLRRNQALNMLFQAHFNAFWLSQPPPLFVQALRLRKRRICALIEHVGRRITDPLKGPSRVFLTLMRATAPVLRLRQRELQPLILIFGD